MLYLTPCSQQISTTERSKFLYSCCGKIFFVSNSILFRFCCFFCALGVHRMMPRVGQSMIFTCHCGCHHSSYLQDNVSYNATISPIILTHSDFPRVYYFRKNFLIYCFIHLHVESQSRIFSKHLSHLILCELRRLTNEHKNNSVRIMPNLCFGGGSSGILCLVMFWFD